MKPAYSNLSLKCGVHIGGLYKVQIAPIEWLIEKVVFDFATGAAIEPLLQDGKEWITLELTPDSYSYIETPGTSKAGDNYTTAITGTSNTITKEIRQVLETLRYHQFIVKATDADKQTRLCGDIDAGMKLQIPNDNTNDTGGKLSVGFSLSMAHEKSNPFVIEACAGIENFTEVNPVVNDADPPTFMSLVFSGGNLVGITEVEIINLPGETHLFILPAGTSSISGENDYWTDYLSTETFTVRWRRRCAGGKFSAWLASTFNNPFF